MWCGTVCGADVRQDRGEKRSSCVTRKWHWLTSAAPPRGTSVCGNRATSDDATTLALLFLAGWRSQLALQ